MDTPDATARGIARAVTDALQGAGISQRTASVETGIPLTTLTRRLTGKSPFLITELAALASLADTTVSALIAAGEKDAA